VTQLDRLQPSYDVAVIGAGPAGLAAGALTARAGLATIVLDENPGPGGQVYRSITSTPLRDPRALGADYWRGLELVRDLDSSGAQLVSGAVVWSVSRDLEIGISLAGSARMFSARRIILATGALERPFPIPGWTLPGVMTAGGGQTLLKSSALAPQGRTVLAGSGPLLWLFAAQLLNVGGSIDAILDTTPSRNLVRALPYLPGFLLSPYLAKGLSLLSQVRRKVRIVRGVTRLAALGGDKVREVAFVAGGHEATLPVDHLFLHQGVVPNVNLAMSLGIEHRWDSAQLCWTPILDDLGVTSIPGISIAGDGAGIGGAWVAEARGRLAGLQAVDALTGGTAGVALPSEQPIRQTLQRYEIGRAFLDTLYRPSSQFRLPEDDSTIVCRCEEVTAGQIRDTVKLGCEGPNQMKSFLRCGMGPCQGRLCGLTVTELIAAARGVPPADVGYYRLRPPVKPIALAELANLPQTDAANAAVVRP
jgi:NADPH-dependent 2,4-dienoyl-CoA reductase/sulfur reductase-like enzyme